MDILTSDITFNRTRLSLRLPAPVNAGWLGAGFCLGERQRWRR